MKARSGFTLVEILIVVIILGILAAIVIPQFTNASTQARENSLRANLQTMRSQIELYKVQHSDALPEPDGDFSWDRMTQKTTIAGTVDAAGDYGPYLQQVPVNPFNDLVTVGVDETAGSSTYGWMFNTTTGAIQADDSNDHAGW